MNGNVTKPTLNTITGKRICAYDARTRTGRAKGATQLHPDIRYNRLKPVL